MTDIRYIIDGQNLGEPRNWKELEITFNWLEQKETGTLETTRLEFVHRAFQYLNQRLRSGMTGGVGIFEGVPCQIEIGQQGSPDFVFDGYIDGTDEATFIGSEEISAVIKKAGGDDWLNEVADGFSFAYLESIGEITPADYIKVPYVINYVPDNMQLIMLSFSLYMMTKELIENTEELAKLIGQTINAATPVIGVGAGAGAVAVTAWDLGDWVMYGIYVIAKLVYMVAMTIAIVKLIEQIIEQIFPKMREHLGMTFYTLMERGCNHLGLQFESNLLSNLQDVVYVPQKDRKGGESGETGVPGSNDPVYLFGDLIRVLKQKYNADYIISNGVLRFERRDFLQSASGYVIPNIFSNQERLLNQYTPNTSEFVANYNINFQYDRQDQNTLDDTTGLSYQAITKPVTVINQKLVNMKGLTEIAVPFALGKRKDGLTDLERFAKDVFGVVDDITGIFGGGTNFRNKIEARIGALLLSSHFITVGKVIKMQGSKLATDQRTKLGAKYLFENFHYINSFAPINGVHNQWLRHQTKTVPLTRQDILNIFDNNFVTTEDGKPAQIEQLKWKPYKGTGELAYRTNEIYTNNLKIEYVG